MIAEGIITTVAGTGTAGNAGDGGLAINALLNKATGVWVDINNNVYIADSGNNRIRVVSNNGPPSQVAYVLGAVGMQSWGAISGNQNAQWIWSDAGAATNSNFDLWTFSASFSSTSSYTGTIEVCVDDFATVYLNGQMIQSANFFRWSVCNGIPQQSSIGVIAGMNSIVVNAQSAGGPAGLLLSIKDNSGNYVFTTGSSWKFQRTPGSITTIAGTGTAGNSGDGGAATSAQLNYPQAVAMNSYGNIFIADSSNHKIRMVNSAGIIITIAGTGILGGLGDCGVATSAQLNYPRGVWLDTNDNVYVADTTNHKVRLVWPQVPTFPSVCDFENVVSTTSFAYYVIGSVIGGWTTGGIYSVGYNGPSNPGGGIGILSTQNNIGFASPFPSNLQYACWIATINNAQSFITRTLTGVVVGYAYFVSFWITCRSGYPYPPSQSFTVVMDGVTVYSTSPSSTSWVLVTSATNTALHTSMTLMFQLSNLGGSGYDYGMAVDEVALKRALSSSLPTSQPTTRPSKG